MKKNKEISFKKALMFSLIAILLFFLFLELGQRVRYTIRFHSIYWLFYGFIDKPKDYSENMYKVINKIEQSQVQLIEVPSIVFKSGKNRYRKYNPKVNEYGYINPYGFRNKDFSLIKGKDIYRIICLGGSTTFGFGVDDNNTYPELLSVILNKQGDTLQVEVINAGIAGSTIFEISNLLQNEILPLNPDMIIISSVFNNFYYSELVYKTNRLSLRMLSQFLLGKSVFYMTLREKISSSLHQKIDDVYKLTLNDTLANFIHNEAFWKDLENVYREVIEIAKANNIEVVLIKEPVKLGNYEQKDTGILLNNKFSPVYQKFYDLLDKKGKEYNCLVIDAERYFDDNPRKEELFKDGLHLTVKGNKYLSDLVSSKINKIISR
jgi:lysophospholipase L1-like esterase